MTADTLVSDITQLLYLVIFVTTVIHWIRRPRRVNLDIALFFGTILLLIAASGALLIFNITPPAFLTAVTSSLLMALPYLLVRLVNDFTTVPDWIMRASEGGLALLVLGLFLIQPLPLWLTLVCVLYFVLLELYAASVFIRQARKSPGLTSRRMQAAALGSLFWGLLILIVGFQVVFPALTPLWSLLMRTAGLFSGLGYLLGFAPPGWVRRAWQMPELREFLTRASRLHRLADTQAILRELERGATHSLGATGAVISLWDEGTHRLHLTVREPRHEQRTEEVANEFPINPLTNMLEFAPNELVSGRVFTTQKPIFVEDIARIDPRLASQYYSNDASSLLGAPMTTGNKRLGVLLVYGPRPALFADDDLALLQLLADQAATILESRALIDEASQVQAREETARLKEDFFSAAAHDLRTPLTALLSQTQLLRRRAVINPDAPVDLRGLQRIEDETRRLIRFVNELLDVSRAEQGRLLGERDLVDLVALASELSSRPRLSQQEIIVEAAGPLIGFFDQKRIEQVFENLLENGIKYSPQGDGIVIKLWEQNGEAHFKVCDHGIGIPVEELPRIFERFHRGTNVNDRQFAGLGLGLFICRSIVEAHGGRIDAESKLGEGTSVHCVLPLRKEEGSGD